MRWLHLIEIIKENIDAFNISIITGLITGWFVVLLDSKFKDIRIKRTGFIDDRYRRFQNTRRLTLMINRIIEIFRITEQFPEDQIEQRNLLILLALEDAKKEIDMEVEILNPYYYFREEYLTENMKTIVSRETDNFTKVKDLINVRNIDEVDLVELAEQKGLLWRIAFDMRREPRKKVKFEILRTVLQDKTILLIMIVAIGAVIIA